MEKGADVKVSKADIAEKVLDDREESMDRLSQDLAVALQQAGQALDRELARIENADQRAEVIESLRSMVTAEGKATKRQVAKGFEKILNATPSYKDILAVGRRLLDLYTAQGQAETVIRNFLYTHALRANLQVRALRRVLDSRLGTPITDEELKKATEKIVEEDQKAARKVQDEKQTEDFEQSLKEATEEQATEAATS